MKKRIVTLFCAIALCFTFSSSALAELSGESITSTGSYDNFNGRNTYIEGQFADINSSQWYYENVKTVFEMGLMEGTGDLTFDAKGEVTGVQAIVIAARLHSIYCNDKYVFEKSKDNEPWYQPYIDYSIENGIMYPNTIINEGVTNRRGFIAYIKDAIPNEALEVINNIAEGAIPDVEFESNIKAIYLFYRAGILTGTFGDGSFLPETSITRAEVATIVTRLANPALRKRITIGTPEYTTKDNNVKADTNPSVESIELFLKENYGTINTVLGDVDIKNLITVSEVKSPDMKNTFAYDFMIEIHDAVLSRIGKQHTKEQAIEYLMDLKEHEKMIGTALIQAYPTLKFEGCYSSSYYTYPNLKIGMNSKRYFSWNNYDDKKGNISRNYYNTGASIFRFDEFLDSTLIYVFNDGSRLYTSDLKGK